MLRPIMLWGWLLLATLPATTNYALNSYGFGSGGTAGSSTSNYSTEGISGEVSGQSTLTVNYTTEPGFIETQQADVPAAPTFTNPSNYYDKLHLVIATSGNPSDALFAIAISDDDFVTDTRYVQSDDTIGSPLVLGDYKTYASGGLNWGGSSGFNIIGLAANTTYTVKVKATQGAYTESAYGPTASAATVGQELSFSVAPNSEALGDLLPGTVITSPSNVTALVATNADAGGDVFITGQYGGLDSSSTGYLIGSTTANLATASQGFGVQGVSTTATSGTLNIDSPYNVSSQNVGQVATTLQAIFASTGPLVGGQGVFSIMGEASVTTPAATDYQETLTVVAAAIF